MPPGAHQRSMFQFFMNDILREHLDIFCVGILDDVIVYSATPESMSRTSAPSSRSCENINSMQKSKSVSSVKRR